MGIVCLRPKADVRCLVCVGGGARRSRRRPAGPEQDQGSNNCIVIADCVPVIADCVAVIADLIRNPSRLAQE